MTSKTISKLFDRTEVRFSWAEEVTAAKDRGSEILIKGEDWGATTFHDLLDRYLDKDSDDSERGAPHVRFASATNRKQLMEFIGEFGPVVVDPESFQSKKKRGGFRRQAVQNWEVLLHERKAFASLLRILEVVRRERDTETAHSTQRTGPEVLALIEEVIEVTRQWSAQWRREMRWRDTQRSRSLPFWSWGIKQQGELERQWYELGLFLDPETHPDVRKPEEPVKHYAHRALCIVLNSFPTTIKYDPRSGVDRASDLPDADLTLGIRPMLYYMLRTDYIQDWAIRSCHREGCQNWFRPGRKREPYCGPRCSKLVRDLQYYHGVGKEKRKAKAK